MSNNRNRGQHRERGNAPSGAPNQQPSQQAPRPHAHKHNANAAFGERFSGMSAREVASFFSNLATSGSGYTGMGTTFPMGRGHDSWLGSMTIPQMPGTSKLSMPKPDDYRLQATWARSIRDTTLVNGPLVRRRQFVVAGFKHRHHDERVTRLFNRIARESKLKKRLKEIEWELESVGWVVVMPDGVNKMPQDIHLVQDGIENMRAFGQDNLTLNVDSTVTDRVNATPEQFPPYVVNAVKNGQIRNGKLPLPSDEVYFLTTERGINQPFPRSPLFPLFEPVKAIDNLVETQFAISFAIKQLMLHVQVSGGVDINGKEKAPNIRQLQLAARQVFDGARVSTIVTPNTTKLTFVSPEKDIFEATDKPYMRALERILIGIRIPMILVNGSSEGASFSTASYAIKGFLQAVIDERETLLDDFVYPWYRKKAEELYEDDQEKYAFLYDAENDDWNIPTVIFNETELKNLPELIALAKFKWQTGMYSGQTIMEMFQDDFDIEKKRKLEFNKDADKWVNLPWEPSQGASDALLDHNAEQKDADREHQADLQGEQLKVQQKISQQQVKARPQPGGGSGAPAGQKAPGQPGRPPKGDSRPRSDSVDKNPRAGGPSPK